MFIILAFSSVSSPLFAKTLNYTCNMTNAKNSRNWIPQTIKFEKTDRNIKLNSYSSILKKGS